VRGGLRFDRRERCELEDLVRHDREFFAEHPTGLRTRSRREESARDEAEDEEAK